MYKKISKNEKITRQITDVHFEDGDVLYLDKDTEYSANGKFEAVVINSPAFGVIKE